MAGSAAGPPIARLAGDRGAMAGGLLAVGGAALVLAGVGEGSPYAQLLLAFVLLGAGLGWASVASTALGTAALPATRQGLAAGVLGTAAQLGTVLGLALFIPLAAAADEAATGYTLGAGAAAVTAVAIALVLAAGSGGYTRTRPPLHGTEDAREEGPRRRSLRRRFR